MSSRRKFLQNTALGLAGSVTIPLLGRSGRLQPESVSEKATSSLSVGVAGYTFAGSTWRNPSP
jgi:hypothetical protein